MFYTTIKMWSVSTCIIPQIHQHRPTLTLVSWSLYSVTKCLESATESRPLTHTNKGWQCVNDSRGTRLIFIISCAPLPSAIPKTDSFKQAPVSRNKQTSYQFTWLKWSTYGKLAPVENIWLPYRRFLSNTQPDFASARAEDGCVKGFQQ